MLGIIIMWGAGGRGGALRSGRALVEGGLLGRMGGDSIPWSLNFSSLRGCCIWRPLRSFFRFPPAEDPKQDIENHINFLYGFKRFYCSEPSPIALKIVPKSVLEQPSEGIGKMLRNTDWISFKIKAFRYRKSYKNTWLFNAFEHRRFTHTCFDSSQKTFLKILPKTCKIIHNLVPQRFGKHAVKHASKI